MQSGTAIAVMTATLMAICVALGTATSGGGPNRLEGVKGIMYVRSVEHGRLALLGDCPLEREIIIERTGKARISWYVQNSLFHGCGRAIAYAPDRDDEEISEEPKVARIELNLTSAEIDRIIDKLNQLSWNIKWSTVDELIIAHAIGCADTGSDSFPDRKLFIDKSKTQTAYLAVDEDMVPDSGTCISKEKANALKLDAAFAPFVPLLPDKYELNPEVASRLYRKE